MKKLVLAIAILSLAGPASFAQGKSKAKAKGAAVQTTEHQTIQVAPPGAATPVGARRRQTQPRLLP